MTEQNLSWSNGLSITSWRQQEYLYNIRFISDRELTATAKALYGSDLSAKPGDESTNLKIALIVTGSFCLVHRLLVSVTEMTNYCNYCKHYYFTKDVIYNMWSFMILMAKATSGSKFKFGNSFATSLLRKFKISCKL